MPMLLSIGEVMIELADAGGGLMRKGQAGDTFNTAFYARACLPADWQVQYLTGLGRDAASGELLAAIGKAGIGTRFIRFDETRVAGLYMIHLEKGERSFSYWRDRSAARLLASESDRLDSAMAEASLIYCSGITLAILEGDGRANLLAALVRARAAGKTIAFDPNLRPRLWADAACMRDAIMAAAAVADIVLPSLDDEIAHFGDQDGAATIERYRKAGASMVVLKDGANGVTLATAEGIVHVPASPVDQVVDSTAAGDSFNGGFLAGLLTGKTLQDAARQGAELAAGVIGHPGAIIDPALLGL